MSPRLIRPRAIGTLIGSAALLATATTLQAQCTTPCAAAADFSRLSMAIEVHVENSLLGTEAETAYVRSIAEAANAAGIPLNFGLGVDFLDDYAAGIDSSTHTALASSLSDLVSYLQSDCCHEVSLHADVPETMAGTDIPTYLAPYLSQLSTAGAVATLASGVCNEAGDRYGWVEAARDAGLTGIAGVVEYCQASLRERDDDYITPDSCTPSTCHDAAPVDRPEQRVATWRTRRSRRWTTPSRGHRRALVILSGMGNANFPCLGEVAAGGPPNCGSSGYSSIAAATPDATAFVDLVAGAQASYRSGDAGDVVYLTFSTNLVANSLWLNAMFAGIQSQLESRSDGTGATLEGLTQWTTLSRIVTANQ